MLLFRTILHPTDFSPAAEYAFELAGSLARDHGAELIILHVRSPKGTDAPVWLQKEEIWDEFHRLEQTDPHIRDIRIRSEFVDGDPVKEILHVAEKNGCDLIVMGTHGRTGVKRLLMGSVAEKVSRESPCPVMTVKSPTLVPAGAFSGVEAGKA
jgi:nucleotide-binding universal stress UspA family protein